MSQLIIKDLNFCDQDLPRRQKIKGSASFFAFDFDWDSDAVFDNSGPFATGFTLGFALSIGDKLTIASVQSFAVGSDSGP